MKVIMMIKRILLSISLVAIVGLCVFDIKQVAPASQFVIKSPYRAPVLVVEPIVNESLVLINNTRASLGLGRLAVTTALDDSASAKCKHMVDNDYWAHDGGGVKWYSFVKATLPSYRSAGEILGQQEWTNNAVLHEAWLNSPLHYDVVVGNYQYFGMARCTYRGGNVLTVVHFARV